MKLRKITFFSTFSPAFEYNNSSKALQRRIKPLLPPLLNYKNNCNINGRICKDKIIEYL